MIDVCACLFVSTRVWPSEHVAQVCHSVYGTRPQCDTADVEKF